MSAPFLENDVDLITAEPGAVRRCEATILHVGETGHLRRAAMIKVPLGGSVKLGNMVGKLIHYVPIEGTRLGERIEQQSLTETPHHEDPIESLAVRRKADGAAAPSQDAPTV